MITLVKPSFEILSITDNILQLIEGAGRTCYKSESLITDESASKFVKMVTERGHHSVIEHGTATVRIICDRGVTHELVRHRLASYSQESTRYVNYKKRGITFVIPPWTNITPGTIEMLPDTLSTTVDEEWIRAMWDAASYYNTLIDMGWSPEKARAVLPNSLKTEIVVTANVREWRHIFNLRCSKAAHPQIREVLTPLLFEMSKRIPMIFDDLVKKYE